MKKRIRIQGFLIFVAVIFMAIFYKYLLPGPAAGSARTLLDIIGVTLFLLGYFLRTASRGYKAELNPDGKTLVTTGPYAITRNPMYLGTLFVGLGIILLVLKWWVAAVFLLIYLLIYIPQIKQEEKKLHDFFQEAFRDYCKGTPRFFPGVKGLMQPDAKIKFKLAWVKKEIFSFSAVSFLVIAVKTWGLLRR